MRAGEHRGDALTTRCAHRAGRQARKEVGVVGRVDPVVLVAAASSARRCQLDGVLYGRVGLERHADPQPVPVHGRHDGAIRVDQRFALDDRCERQQLMPGELELRRPRVPGRIPPLPERGREAAQHRVRRDRPAPVVRVGEQIALEARRVDAQLAQQRGIPGGRQHGIARDPELALGDLRDVDERVAFRNREPHRDGAPFGGRGARSASARRGGIDRARRAPVVELAESRDDPEPCAIADDAVCGQAVGDRAERDALAEIDLLARGVFRRTASHGGERQDDERPRVHGSPPRPAEACRRVSRKCCSSTAAASASISAFRPRVDPSCSRMAA